MGWHKCLVQFGELLPHFFFFLYMPTLKALAFAMPTRHWFDVGAETGWEGKVVIEHFPRKCSFYSSSFF